MWPRKKGGIVSAKWVDFVPTVPNKKTKVWFVYPTGTETSIGLIKWFGRWRKYSFFPEPGTVYEIDCLSDIAKFLEEATRQHKAGR